MNHYEVLGVTAGASKTEVRAAYLRLARAHHPDFTASAGEEAVLRSAMRMREVNAAWQVLGDSSRRLDYDRYLKTIASGGQPAQTTNVASPKGSGIRIERPSTAFTPYSADDEDDDDSWRYEPDEGDPATVPPKLLLAAPAACFVLGIGLLAASAPTGIRPFAAFGLIFMILSALLFMGAPVVALFKSQLAEQRSAQARRRGYRRRR